MEKLKRYEPQSFDMDKLMAISKLSLDSRESASFLADICEMANYTYENLRSESADGTLAVRASKGGATDRAKRLCELREDEVADFGESERLISLAPDSKDGHVCVPKTVGKAEE